MQGYWRKHTHARWQAAGAAFLEQRRVALRLYGLPTCNPSNASGFRLAAVGLGEGLTALAKPTGLRGQRRVWS